jgi:hypothetical protein
MAHEGPLSGPIAAGTELEGNSEGLRGTVGSSRALCAALGLTPEGVRIFSADF